MSIFKDMVIGFGVVSIIATLAAMIIGVIFVGSYILPLIIPALLVGGLIVLVLAIFIVVWAIGNQYNKLTRWKQN